MSSHFTVRVLLLLAVLCVSAARPVAADDKSKDEAAIREIAKTFETTHNKHDARAFAALFVPDGDFTNVRGMSARGRKAIEEFHRPLFEGDTSKGNPHSRTPSSRSTRSRSVSSDQTWRAWTFCGLKPVA